jgi:type I restriction enzyme S subunit
MRVQSYPTIRLGEAVDRVTKGTTPTTHGYPYTDHGVSFLRVENLQNGVVDTSKVKTFISPEADQFLKRSSLESGDVLISIAGTIGRTAIVRDHDIPANTNQAVAIIRGAAKRFEPVFLRFALESPLLHRHITGEARGGAMQNISLENVRDVVVPIPVLEEQRWIVAEIEKQFTRLETGVAALRRVQANLKRYRAAVLKAACEGRLVPTEAELAKSGNRKATFESGEALLARILTERRQNWKGRGKYKEPVAPDTTNLPSLPDGWTWASLESVSEAVGGFAFSSAKFVDAGYQVVKMANIRMGKIDLTQRASFISDVTPDVVEKYSLRQGDLVVTLTGTRKKRDYGYVAVVKNQAGLLLNQRIARVRPFAGMDSSFLQLVMQAEHYRDRFFSHETGNVGQGNVGMAAVTKEIITLPPLAEQTRIVAEVERRLSVVEESESVVSANLQRANRLRQSILYKAFAADHDHSRKHQF